MIAYRPVLEVRALPAQGLLLFVGHTAFWRGALPVGMGIRKLSDEGVTITSVEGIVLRGLAGK